jgi:S-adenosylmethionine:tRNA ribosyltransferase-isomerase
MGHPRLVALRLDGSPDAVWAGIARHGRPIQYSYMPVPLELWDVWSPIAGPPVAFEPPSAGFALDWRMLVEIRSHGTRFVTITHAAGISSTGDAELDRLLPFDEPYTIPRSAALEIGLAQAQGGRIIAIGTTVVRALEDAVMPDGRLRSGEGLATGRIGPGTQLSVVDAIVSGTHEPGTSHYELLRAFADDDTLVRANRELETLNYRTHEFGDSVFIERSSGSTAAAGC